MTLEERLNEIVEKQQGDAIIPFLQRLTQEERKSLVPCLNKLEEYYSKFVQLNENTYGTRGTSAQHRIINLTALVIYSLKEFRKHQWGINTEQRGTSPPGSTAFSKKVKAKNSAVSTEWITKS